MISRDSVEYSNSQETYSQIDIESIFGSNVQVWQYTIIAHEIKIETANDEIFINFMQ